MPPLGISVFFFKGSVPLRAFVCFSVSCYVVQTGTRGSAKCSFFPRGKLQGGPSGCRTPIRLGPGLWA